MQSIIVKNKLVKKLGTELQRKSDIHLVFSEDVLIYTHGKPCPSCLGLLYFREKKCQNNYCFPEKNHMESLFGSSS